MVQSTVNQMFAEHELQALQHMPQH